MIVHITKQKMNFSFQEPKNVSRENRNKTAIEIRDDDLK